MIFEDRYDKEVMSDTPLGPLSVIEWGEGDAVAVMWPCEPTKVRRIIYMLKPGENPLNAVYGRRPLEDRAVQYAYERLEASKAEVREREAADRGRDFRREVGKMLAKDHSGATREAIFRLLQAKG